MGPTQTGSYLVDPGMHTRASKHLSIAQSHQLIQLSLNGSQNCSILVVVLYIPTFDTVHIFFFSYEISKPTFHDVLLGSYFRMRSDAHPLDDLANNFPELHAKYLPLLLQQIPARYHLDETLPYQFLCWASKRSHTWGKCVTCCGLLLSLITSSINPREQQELAL